MTTLLLTGASGMLGRAIVEELRDRYRVVAVGRTRVDTAAAWERADLLDAEVLERAVRRVRPGIVVHAAALTDVDACERDPQAAEALNVDATRCLAALSRERRARLVYISTDQVFDGRASSAYRETDRAAPVNVYGKTKLAGEQAAGSTALVLRTNVFGWRDGTRPGLAAWLLDGLERQETRPTFTDVRFSPLSTPLLAKLITAAIERGLSGVYHAGGAEALSKHDFALRLAAAFGLSTARLQPTSVGGSGLAAARPNNMTLDSSRLASALGIALPSIEASIAAWKATRPSRSGI